MVDGRARITVRIAFEILCALDAGARERNKQLLALGRAEEQTKKFIVDTFRGAEDGGQEADIAIVSNHRIMSMLLCRSGFLQRLVDAVRVRARRLPL